MSDSQLTMEIRTQKGRSWLEADSRLGTTMPEGVFTVTLYFTEEGEQKLINLRIPITRIDNLFRVFFGTPDSSAQRPSFPWREQTQEAQFYSVVLTEVWPGRSGT